MSQAGLPTGGASGVASSVRNVLLLPARLVPLIDASNLTLVCIRRDVSASCQTLQRVQQFPVSAKLQRRCPTLNQIHVASGNYATLMRAVSDR